MIKSLLNPFKKAELPIWVFEAGSNVEWVMRTFELAPYYLSKAADVDWTKSPYEWLCLVIALAISGITHSITFKKSFDPVIGETYQSTIQS